MERVYDSSKALTAVYSPLLDLVVDSSTLGSSHSTSALRSVLIGKDWSWGGSTAFIFFPLYPALEVLPLSIIALPLNCAYHIGAATSPQAMSSVCGSGEFSLSCLLKK